MVDWQNSARDWNMPGPGLIALEPGPPNALWNSDGIRLRDQPETNLQNIGGNVNPTSGSSYYAYVKVTNVGGSPIGDPGPSPVQTQAASVYIQRVRLSTMPNQVDYTLMGNATSAIAPGQSLWIEFPPTPWVNPASSTPGAHY